MNPYRFLPKQFQWMVLPVVCEFGGGGQTVQQAAPAAPAPPPAPPSPAKATTPARTLVNAMIPRHSRGSTVLTRSMNPFGDPAAPAGPIQSILGQALTPQ